MRRWASPLTLSCIIVAASGCGSSDAGPTTGPSGDNRPTEQKQSDDLMQKALQKARKPRDR